MKVTMGLWLLALASAPVAEAQTSESCNEQQEDTHFGGVAFVNFSSVSASECCEACTNGTYPNCEAWSWNGPTSNSADDDCSLFARPGDAVSTKGVVSGLLASTTGAFDSTTSSVTDGGAKFSGEAEPKQSVKPTTTFLGLSLGGEDGPTVTPNSSTTAMVNDETVVSPNGPALIVDAYSDRFASQNSLAVAMLISATLSILGSAFIMASVTAEHSGPSKKVPRAVRNPRGAAVRRGCKPLDLMTHPSLVLIVNIAATNIVFGLAMVTSGVAVLFTTTGFVATFSSNQTMLGEPNKLCTFLGGLQYTFMIASSLFCVALSIASFRLTRGKPFVSNKWGVASVYLICYGGPFVMSATAYALGLIGFQTQNAWCSVVTYEAAFIVTPGIVCIVLVLVMVGLMTAFAGKMNQASGKRKTCCLNIQYTRLVLLCVAFTAVTAMSLLTKGAHQIATDSLLTQEEDSEVTYAYDMANAIVYCSLGFLNALAYGLPHPRVRDAMRCRCRRQKHSIKSGVFNDFNTGLRFDAFFEGSNDSTSNAEVEMPEHGTMLASELLP